MGAATTTARSLSGSERTLHVRLLGGLGMRLGETPLPPPDSGRAASLLAYLLVHRDVPQPRERLAFVLWSDSTESQARTNLRHVLHNLRRVLPDAERFIDVRPRTLQWRLDAPAWVDVASFEQAIAEGRLADAVDVYSGELLESCYDEWLTEERARLARLHVDALEELARQRQAQGRWREAISYAERLVGQEPLHEAAHRLLIGLCEAAGDRARALRAYHRCATTLQRELGVDPSEETQAAYEALLPTPSEPAPAPPPPTSPPRSPLVGRVREQAQLSALWDEAQTGRAHVALVTGEPGIGKSRLVEELRASCAHEGAVTPEARAYAAEGAMAHGVVVSWLRSPAVAARLPRLPRPTLTELARLVPELLGQMPDLPAPQPLPEDEQRQRLFAALTQALLAAGAPLLLLVDDLQWCDVQTLQFLHYLVRSQPDAPLLIAATARREDLDTHHPATRLLAAVQGLGRLSEVRLGRLTHEETGVLAQHLAGRGLSDAEVERLSADSEGNPLFVVEAVSSGVHHTATTSAGISAPVQAVITSRLAQLSREAADLVGVAATIGREFTADVLAEASGADEAAFVRGLDELWRRGLVRAHGPNAYDFSHGKIRDVAYHALSPAQACAHHLRVARVLQRSRNEALDAVSGQVAAHFDQAGEPDAAVRWYVTAAAAAQRLHANADAVRLLERALVLVRSLPDSTERPTLELRILTALPAPLVSVEGYLSERVGEVHDRALRLTAALGVEADAPLVRSLALAALSRDDFRSARPLGERLRALAERDGDDVLWVESAYVLGVAEFWQGELDAARSHFAAAVARCRPEHRVTHLLHYGQDSEAFCGLRLGYTLWLLGRADASRRACEAALARAEEVGHPFTRVSTTAWAALLALEQGDEARLRRLVHALASDQAADSSKPTRLFVEALAGHVNVLDGRAELGLRRVRRALEDARTGQPAAPGLPAIHLRILLEACRAAEDASAGLAAADEALAVGGGTQLWEAEIRRLRGAFLSALAAPPEEVEAQFRRALEVARRQGAKAIEARVRETIEELRVGAV